MHFYRKFSVLFLILIIPFGLLVAQPANPTIDSLINLISIESYKSHFKHLKTDSSSFKEVTNTLAQSDDHDACRDYIFKTFENYFGEANVYSHDCTIEDYSGLSNVIAYKEGIYPWKGIIVISAHYDACNSRELKDTLKIAPGANDNGTGMAAMLEIARILSKIQTERSVLFTAWDIEEFMYSGYPAGSNQWYSEFVDFNQSTDWINIGKGGKICKKDVYANINFDMIGNPQDTLSGKPLLWVCTGNSSHKKFALEYISTFNTYIHEISLKNKGVMIYSDHYTFASRRIPAVMNLESDYEKDPYFHTVYDNTDNPDNIDFDFAANVSRGGFAFILQNIGITDSAGNIENQKTADVTITEQADCYIISSSGESDSLRVYDFSGKPVIIEKEGSDFKIRPPKKGVYFIYPESIGEIIFKKVLLEKKKSRKN